MTATGLPGGTLNPQSSILVKISSSKIGLAGEDQTIIDQTIINESPLNICGEQNLDYIHDGNIVI